MGTSHRIEDSYYEYSVTTVQYATILLQQTTEENGTVAKQKKKNCVYAS